jgi:RNA polymerase sigma-70 factor (ECF subfamily)
MSEHQTTHQIMHCLDRLRAGDRAARTELLNAAVERLQRLTRKMLKDFPGVRRWEETGDVCQNAAVRLWRALQDVAPGSVLEFMRLAALNIRRELIDLARHHYGAEGAGAHHNTPGPVPGTDSGMPPDYDRPAGASASDRLNAWAEFHQRVQELPGESKEVFDLLWYQGLSQAETAEILGVSERTVKRRWQAARLMLHDAMHGFSPEHA